MQLPFEFMTVHTQSNGAAAAVAQLDEELFISSQKKSMHFDVKNVSWKYIFCGLEKIEIITSERPISLSSSKHLFCKMSDAYQDISFQASTIDVTLNQQLFFLIF